MIYRTAFAMALVLAVVAVSCRLARPVAPPVAIPLVDVFGPERIAARRPLGTAPKRVEWSFAALAPGQAWSAGPGVAGLEVRDGALAGRSTTPQPVVELSATAPLGDGDRLHAIEVRMRVSAGTTLRLNSFAEGGLPTATFGGTEAPLGLESPLLPGSTTNTYRIVMAKSFAPGGLFERSRVKRLVLRPTDAAGATFAIESVRLVYRREHLAEVPSGVGWRGLGEVYRESLVTRPGEVVRLPVRLPPRPLLDLAVGTLAELPVAFRVAVRKGEGGAERTVLRHTVTTTDRWEVDPVPLDEWAGEEVELVLRADCESADALAFWGGPAVRSRLAGSAAPAADRPQGVVLVIADTLRRDHLDAWGYGRATAPTLRRLAGEGVQFRDAVAQGVWTKVSVPSILTSLYPSTHGIVDFTDRVPAAATTLAEAYRAAGYATFATSAVSFSGQLSNLHQGTEVLHEQGSFTPASEELRTKQARDFVGRAIAFIESHREVPFLVVLHVFDPHAPYRPFEPYDQMWSSPAETDWFRGEEEKVRKLIPATSPRRRVAAPTRDEMERAGIDEARFLKHEVGLYDGSIRGLDAEIGRLMDRLEHLGLADRVVLAFLADHGEEFLEHGSHWHGMNVYGENANVPLALWAPRYLPKGVTVEPTVQLIDVMPTLLELSGLPVPERAQGKSLLSLVRAAAEGKEAVGWHQRPAFTERSPRGEHEDAAVTNGLAVVKERWKLVQHDPPRPGRPLFELFDHRADPLDRNDLAAAHPDVVRALAGELARWRKWAVAQRLPAESAGSLDAAELARLKSLGYVN